MSKVKAHENNFAIMQFAAVLAIMFSVSNVLTNSNDDIWGFISGYQAGILQLGESTLLLIIGYISMQSMHKYKNVKSYIYARFLAIYPQLIISILIIAIVAYILLLKGLYFRNYFLIEDIKGYLLNIFIPLTQNRYLFIGDNLWIISVVVRYNLLLVLFSLINLIRFRCLILSLFIVILIFIQTHLYSSYSTYYYECLMSGSLFWLFKDKIKYKNYGFIFSILVMLFTGYLGGYWNIAFLVFGAYLLFAIAFNQRIKFYKFNKYGNFNYGMFLYGFMIQNVVIIMFNGQMTNVVNFLISLPIAVLCGALSYWLVEKPCMNLKKKFCS